MFWNTTIADGRRWRDVEVTVTGAKNGAVFTFAGKIVDTKGHILASPAADSFFAAQEAAGGVILLNSAWRSNLEQAALEKSKPELAAKSGWSPHQAGIAIDVKKGAGREWLRKHGAAYGWVATVSREPWHFEFRGRP